MVEQDGVFAHEVIHGLGLTAEGDDVLADGVEAKECLLVVDHVELEHGRCGVHPNLCGCFLDQAQLVAGTR